MKQKLYHRERYLERLRPFYHDDDIIKVITGVRHLNLMEFLKEDGDLL